MDRTDAAPEDTSAVAALVLTCRFGPLGLFYSTVKGLIMLLVPLIVLPFTAGFGLFVVSPVTMLWGAIPRFANQVATASKGVLPPARMIPPRPDLGS